jgi:hypothetical protein
VRVAIFCFTWSLWSASLAQTPFQEAQWLRDPRFDGQPVLGVFDAQGTKAQATALKNVHTYFRKPFVLAALPQRAVLRFSADDYAKVYLNGACVVQGPEPSYPFDQPYYDVDVTPHVHAGENVLAAHVYYHGLATRAFNSADNRSGFVAVLTLTGTDGSVRTVATDGTWKAFASQMFSSDKVFGYNTQFNENMDLNLEPAGWRGSGFDDAAWAAPLTGFQDHVFVCAMTAPLQHAALSPVALERAAPDRWFADMGTEVVGHTRIRVRGGPRQTVTVWHGEELSAPQTVRHAMRCNCDYTDRITLTGGDDLAEFFDYRAFRYIEVIGATNRPLIWVDARNYPFDWKASSLRSSDERLNRIWDISKRGVQLGSQGVFVDCASREKGQYIGDAYMTALSQLLLTGDPSLTRKAILDFQKSQRFDSGMLAVAPGGFRQNLAEWSLLWPQMVSDYYRMTGDRVLVERLVREDAFGKLMGWFAQRERPDGLLSGMDRLKWVLVDWPANLRGEYDYENTKNGVNTVINAFYYGALKAAAEMSRAVGQSDAVYVEKAKRLRETFRTVLSDPASGLYIDGLYENGERSPKTSLHANGFALYFGLVPQENRAAVVALMRQQRLNCGIYGAPYFIAALFQNGEPDLAYELLTCDDVHSWGHMLKENATTPFEAWGADQKWNTSLCHPAGGMPVWLVIGSLLGLSPAEPGFKALRVAPHLPSALGSINVCFPTVAGPITVCYERGPGYVLTVPESVRVVDEANGFPIKVKIGESL